MGELPALGPYINAGGWLAVIVLVLVSMVRGWLSPESQVNKVLAQVEKTIEAYKEIIKSKDSQIANLTEANKNSEARADVLADNQRIMLEMMKQVNDSVQRVLEQSRSGSKETIG